MINTMAVMERVEVLVIPQVSDEILQRIQNVDRRINIIDARGWFDVELRATWSQWTVDRYLGSRKYPVSSLDERNRALASAEVVLMGWPPLKDLRARAPRLKWVHELPRERAIFWTPIFGAPMFGWPPPAGLRTGDPWLSMCWQAFSTSLVVCT